ncbi:MAG: hypothetical protein OEY64_03685 [Nitrospinota bacterium]|nr:hypothetical protein [Nitrospinota bacterium]
MVKKKKLIVTLQEEGLLEKVNSLPKSARGRVVEASLRAYFDSPAGKSVLDVFAKSVPRTTPSKPAKGVLGDFG